MTIANVTAGTSIDAAWGNSVADEINDVLTPAATLATANDTRLDRGVYALGGYITATAGSPGFATTSPFRIASNEVAVTRPAWATGAGFVQVTSNIIYTTDASSAALRTYLAYEINGSGTWIFVNTAYSAVVSIPANTTQGAQFTGVVQVGAGETIRIAPAGEQWFGSGSVTINSSSLLGYSMWAV